MLLLAWKGKPHTLFFFDVLYEKNERTWLTQIRAITNENVSEEAKEGAKERLEQLGVQGPEEGDKNPKNVAAGLKGWHFLVTPWKYSKSMSWYRLGLSLIQTTPRRPRREPWRNWGRCKMPLFGYITENERWDRHERRGYFNNSDRKQECRHSFRSVWWRLSNAKSIMVENLKQNVTLEL